MNDSTKRFSSRVENYVKYRPGYPVALVDFLKAECGLTSEQIIADVGSGTGKLAGLFLENGNRVVGIEPNREMREAAERLLNRHAQFVSVDGTAEHITLSSGSVDMIVAGQAFHWFDREKTRAEFDRILKPGGWVILIWNDRKIDATPFLKDYEDLLLTYGTDYQAVNHRNIDAKAISSFFAPGWCKLATFPNGQFFDFAGLQGRLLSSSYAPEAGHPQHEPMLKLLGELFEKHQINGRVNLESDTLVFYGQL